MKMLDQLNQNGYAVIPGIYSEYDICTILDTITAVHGNASLFGARRFFRQTPGLLQQLRNERLHKLLQEIAPDFFIIKSIYFDKPPSSNWFVSWHQDLNIFVKEKAEIAGFKNWTRKENEYGVQPPAEYLGNIITLRIHLDDADENNGALKIIPHSHSIGVMRAQTISLSDTDSVTCAVPAGGVMLMKPLLFHSSSRATSAKPRRVIHLELCSMDLPEGLEWSQKEII